MALGGIDHHLPPEILSQNSHVFRAGNEIGKTDLKICDKVGLKGSRKQIQKQRLSMSN